MAYLVCDRYLPYQLGGGYVLSYALSAFVASNVDILRYYRSEDVSVGVWFAGVQVCNALRLLFAYFLVLFR